MIKVQMGKLFIFLLGAVAGVGLAIGIGILVIEILLPWEEVCAVLPAALKVVEIGGQLLTDLQAWLVKVEEFLHIGASEQAASEVKSGFDGLLDRAKEITGDAVESAISSATAPLRALIDLAQSLISSIQSTVAASEDIIASIDATKC